MAYVYTLNYFYGTGRNEEEAFHDSMFNHLDENKEMIADSREQACAMMHEWFAARIDQADIIQANENEGSGRAIVFRTVKDETNGNYVMYEELIINYCSR